MLIGPDKFTRPPASQRQRWDAQAPLERMPSSEKYSLGTCMLIFTAMCAVGIAIWAMLFGAVLS